ncbi:MAG TPA: acyl-CoA dehydrogenase [Saprospiraceae bacterium]|nr:acyl-CoA dehydrogenase [Saprospiraceae bacterium]
MTNDYISLRNLRFLIHEVLNGASVNQFEYYQDYDTEAFDMALDAAKSIGDQYLFPYYTAQDKDKAYYKDGVVYVHECMRPAIKAIAEGGWIAAHDTYEWQGQQMPFTLLNAGLGIFYAANANIACHPFLTTGAANLIRTFGNEALNQTYIPNMYNGDWQGTMALTEPQAGSSLSDITTSATPVEGEDYYHIKGQKIYISGGDHNAVDNVVHLTLARIKGAPAGTKGISLFVVPKHRPTEGSELEPNDVTTAGIYGKMGQKGYVAAHIMLGEGEDCRGYLVGEPHKGLKYMFQMMNEARIGTGLVSAGTASAAYYASLKYAHERPQGRHPSNKDVNQPQVLIIEHADVRRMLLFQKAVVEGSFALLMQCSYYADVHLGSEGEEADNAHLLLELLTPIAKSYPAEMGIDSVSTGMQVLGGAGYTDDFPLEQHYRDIRVNAIYEGTTTIHGLDLLGRKVMLNKGKALILLMQEIKKTINEAEERENTQAFAKKLGQSTAQLHETTLKLVDLAMKDKPEVFLADATLYLEYFGLHVMAWLWLKQAIVADKALEDLDSGQEYEFYMGKMQTTKYYYEYELIKAISLRKRLMSEERVTLETKAAFIN